MGLLISYLDYKNAVLIVLPRCNTNKVQRVHSFTAKVVLNEGEYSSSTEALSSLHWMTVEARIKFKVACWIFKCDMGGATRISSQQIMSGPNPKVQS